MLLLAAPSSFYLPPFAYASAAAFATAVAAAAVVTEPPAGSSSLRIAPSINIHSMAVVAVVAGMGISSATAMAGQ